MSTLYRDLSAEEQAKPYSKYFYRKPADPDPAKLKAMETAIAPSKALTLDRINDVFRPDSLEGKIGWCQMPDGSGYVASNLQMPGVTIEMLDWWFAWFCLEDLRYMLWYPPAHFGISISDEDRARTLDSMLPMAQRRIRTEHVIENCNGPCDQKIAISFMAPEAFGLDTTRLSDTLPVTAAPANAFVELLDPPPGVPKIKIPACLCHVGYAIAGGVVLQSFFWLGWRVENRKPCRLIPEGIRVPEPIVRGLGIHTLQEFSNLASFLPQLYSEQNGLVA